MSTLAVIPLGILLISCNVHVTTGAFFPLLRFQVAKEEYRNSFFNSEIIIEGPQAEKINSMEHSDRLGKLEDALNRRSKLEKEYESAKTPTIFDITPPRLAYKVLKVGKSKYQLQALEKKIPQLEKEVTANEFCSMPNICKRAFKNSFFTEKNRWILKDTDSIETKCVKKTFVATRGKKSFADMKRYVKCETKGDKDGKKSPDVYLEASTRYMPGKNLKYFALIVDDNENLKPVAYLMNAPESNSVEITIESA